METFVRVAAKDRCVRRVCWSRRVLDFNSIVVKHSVRGPHEHQMAFRRRRELKVQEVAEQPRDRDQDGHHATGDEASLAEFFEHRLLSVAEQPVPLYGTPI